MTPQEFDALIQKQTRPLVVEFSAAWCMPCRMMEPAFKKVSREYAESLDVLKIDADDSPELLSRLGILGVPTLAGYAGGRRLFQVSGVQDAAALRNLFEVALERQVFVGGPSPLDRILRSVGGLSFIAFWAFLGWHWGFMLLGAFLVFTAFYDRCPVYRALAPRVLDWISGKRSEGTPV